MEEVTISHTAQKFKISALMLSLYLCDIPECSRHSRETLLCCYICKLLVQNIPLFLLSHCCSKKILTCSTDLSSRISRCNLKIAALEEVEETLCVLPLLLCCLHEYSSNLLIAFLLGYLCKKCISAACLALACE